MPRLPILDRALLEAEGQVVFELLTRGRHPGLSHQRKVASSLRAEQGHRHPESLSNDVRRKSDSDHESRGLRNLNQQLGKHFRCRNQVVNDMHLDLRLAF
jgi:hypothetical protein